MDNFSVDPVFDELGYRFNSEDERKPPLHLLGELRLWSAVVYQALEDLKITNHRWEQCRVDAYRWIFNGGDNFIEVCGLASVSPVLVRKTAKRLIIERVNKIGLK